MSNKCILITGAGGGIGGAAALAFARHGAAVIAVDLRHETAAATVEQVRQLGGRGHAIACDVGDPVAVAAMFAEAAGQFGGIDFAFNNAGMTHRYGDTGELDDDLWQRIFRVNLSGVFYCMREELKHMGARGGGAIVNTASVYGLRTGAGLSAYVASKHALVGLSKNAAVEYAGRGIRVNAVCPGAIATNMIQDAYRLAGMDQAQQAQAEAAMAAMHPVRRVGEAGEVADAVAFLCSDQAAFVTGMCFSVDGGLGAA